MMVSFTNNELFNFNIFIYLARPCQRCIKRGLETTCTDGVRKKAKYLQDDENGTNTRKKKNRASHLHNLHRSHVSITHHDTSNDESN